MMSFYKLIMHSYAFNIFMLHCCKHQLAWPEGSAGHCLSAAQGPQCSRIFLSTRSSCSHVRLDLAAQQSHRQSLHSAAELQKPVVDLLCASSPETVASTGKLGSAARRPALTTAMFSKYPLCCNIQYQRCPLKRFGPC